MALLRLTLVGSKPGSFKGRLLSLVPTIRSGSYASCVRSRESTMALFKLTLGGSVGQHCGQSDSSRTRESGQHCRRPDHLTSTGSLVVKASRLRELRYFIPSRRFVGAPCLHTGHPGHVRSKEEGDMGGEGLSEFEEGGCLPIR